MIPQGYKQTEIGIIPQEWRVKQLVELCQNNGDYGINASAQEYDPKLPTYLRITDIDENGKFTRQNISSVNHVKCDLYRLADGDLVFARTGATVGKTYLYNSCDGDLVYAGFLIKFSPNQKEIIPYYLKIYTETAAYWNWVKVVSQRSGQPGINSTEYCSLCIPVPPIEEQRKIAEVLGEWDKAIELQTKIIDKLELRKRALMQRLLSGRQRLPGFSDPWQRVRLGDIGIFDKGYGVPKDKITAIGKKAITYGEIYTKYDIVIQEFHSYIDNITASISKQISSGAILFAGSGETLEDIGKCVVFIDEDIAYAGGDIIVFNSTRVVNSLFLSYCLNSPLITSQKRAYGQGHSVVHILSLIHI